MKTHDGSGNELNLYDNVIAACHNVVVDSFTEEISSRSALRITGALFAIAEDLQKQIGEARKPEIACAKGCWWCCHAYVSVTTLEVLTLAEWIRTRYSPEEFEAVLARVAQGAERRRNLTWKEQEKRLIPCPLLVDRACSVYEARPLACRGFVSRSVIPCRQNVEHPEQERLPVPYYVPYREVAGSIRVGLENGIDQTPLQNDPLELVTALHVALNMPDILERWMTGERVFPEWTFQTD